MCFCLRALGAIPDRLRMRELPHTHSCYVCGEFNPRGLNLRFESDGKTVRASFAPAPEHAGFKTVTHGGILATVLDEIMVWACAVATGRFAFCAEMTVRFHAPANPGEALIAAAELTQNRRDKLFEARATLTNPAGQLVAEATGKYRPIRADEVRGMLTDIIGDVSWLAIQGMSGN